MSLNYDLWQGSGTAKNAAIAIANQVTTEWVHTQETMHPILAALQAGKGDVKTASPLVGTGFTVPIVLSGPTIKTQGVTQAGALTPMPYNRSAGLTQAEYPYSHYRNNIVLDQREMKLLMDSSPRGNLLEARTKQLMLDFKDDVSADLSTASSGGAEDMVMSYLYPLATTNTVGGIPQTTYANWQSNVSASVGSLILASVDDVLDRQLTYRQRKPDWGIATNFPGGFNVFGRIRSQIAPNQLVLNPKLDVQYGIETFSYRSVTFTQDHRAGTTASGTLALIDTETYYWVADPEPYMHDVQRIGATDGYEYFYSYFCGLGCSDPKASAVMTGITG